MSRDSLYRAKAAGTGIWIEGDLIHDIDFGKRRTCIYQTLGEGHWQIVPVDDSTVCEYTGAADRSGRKVFDGDIVKQFADCSEAGENLYFFYKIIWSKEYCAFEGYDIDTKETFLFPDLGDFKVIGNIFDNPELLKGDETE